MSHTRYARRAVAIGMLWMGIANPLYEPVTAQAAQGTALKVVVIEGEDAVNIIQQKTAVAPVVEVRDRNDQPVAGATVNFVIRSGRAAFGGARTLTATTNAAGRAVAAGFAPTGSGTLQISATAAFQGQTAAAVTIAQTTVETAAQAAAVSSAAGTSGGSASGAGAAGGAGSGSGSAAGVGAAGGAGGGGLSATTIGLIGGAIAGGAVAATQLTGGEGAKVHQRYSGPFAFNWTTNCLVERISGTMIIELEPASDAPDAPISTGFLTLTDTTATDVTRPPTCGIQGQGNWGIGGASVTGALSRLEAHFQDSVMGRIAQVDRNYDFTGTLTNGTISGTFAMAWRFGGTQPSQSSGSGPVTLNRVQ